MASILEVITGISEALKGKHEGGTEFGLKRESEALLQGCSIYDPRVIDGFGVQYQGDRLILKYHSEMPLTKVHNKNFETDIIDTVRQLKKHLKEEYRKVTKKVLDIVEEGEIQILVQSANRRTCYVNAVQVYKIGNVEIDSGDEKEYHMAGPDGFFSSKKSKLYDSEQEHFADIAKRWLMNTKG